MNTLLIVCLLSVSQRPYGATCCGGCCKARPVQAAVVPSGPSPLEYVQSLKNAIADKGVEIVAARKEYAEAKDAAIRDYMDGKAESMQPPVEFADKLVSIIADREKLRRELERVQSLLVHQHRYAWSHGPTFVPVDSGVVGAMQAMAARRSVSGLIARPRF
jgi:hypothetical protein